MLSSPPCASTSLGQVLTLDASGTSSSDGVTSRRLVLGGLALGGFATVTAGTTPAVAADRFRPRHQRARILPQVRPVSAQFVADHYGVCAHPTFNKPDSVYKNENQNAWFKRLAAVGASFFRGTYVPGNPQCEKAVDLCRSYGIKWLMLVVPESSSGPTDRTVAQTRAVVRHIAANSADVCLGIEGINEPQQNRSSSLPVPANWAATTVAHQRAIWEEVHAAPSLAGKAVVLGPSLHDTAAFQSYRPGFSGSSGPAHWHQLVAAGIKPFQDWCGVHRYPGGQMPCNALDTRLEYVRSAYGNTVRTWATETGYHNALATPDGHLPADEATSAVYGPRHILEFVAQRGIPVTRYELLDDVDRSSPKSVQEAAFGLWRVESTNPSTWTPKPEVAKVKALIDLLKDPGPAYKPRLVGVQVEVGAGDVQWVVTARRDGTARVFLWRGASVWNPVRPKKIAAGATSSPTIVTDRFGARQIAVGAEVVSLKLR